jgi:hypothetical protein
MAKGSKQSTGEALQAGKRGAGRPRSHPAGISASGRARAAREAWAAQGDKLLQIRLDELDLQHLAALQQWHGETARRVISDALLLAYGQMRGAMARGDKPQGEPR